MSLNASHFILLEMSNKNQILSLARTIFGPDKSAAFSEIFHMYATTAPFGHLLLDFSVNKLEILTVRSSIDTNGKERVITF